MCRSILEGGRRCPCGGGVAGNAARRARYAADQGGTVRRYRRHPATKVPDELRGHLPVPGLPGVTIPRDALHGARIDMVSDYGSSTRQLPHKSPLPRKAGGD